MNQLKAAVVMSPVFRPYFAREVPLSAAASQIKIVAKPGAQMTKTESQLLWLLQTIWDDKHNLFLCRLPLILDELSRLLAADKDARRMVSGYMATLIGEISILGECMRQIDTYFPWARGFEHMLVDREESIRKEVDELMRPVAQLISTYNPTRPTPIVSFAIPSDKRFAYPIEKKRNRENVEKLRRAEGCLDTFWAKADNLMYSSMGNLEGFNLKRLLGQPRRLYRTPEWTEPAASKESKQRPDNEPEIEALAGPLSTGYFGIESPRTRKESFPAAGKVKVKTRAVTDPRHEKATRPQITQEGSSSESQCRLQVDARALKVFRILFYNPNVNTTPGEVAWKDFIHAMASTGFTAQKLYGSVWHFQPSGSNMERSIQFHQPHPSPKLPFHVARSYGRRLTRAYGWVGDTFVAKAKA